MTDCAETVLQFWFGDSASGEDRTQMWFGGGPDIDRAIGERFRALPPKALRGEFEAWRERPRPALALILVLDQFPRNLYRGTAESFAYDRHALEVAVEAIDNGFDRRLEPVEAAFLYMPFEHSEDLQMQQRSLALFRGLVERAPQAQRDLMKNFESYALRHHRIIERFGRFPHRNAILGRPTTDEERSYLESGGDTF